MLRNELRFRQAQAELRSQARQLKRKVRARRAGRELVRTRDVLSSPVTNEIVLRVAPVPPLEAAVAIHRQHRVIGELIGSQSPSVGEWGVHLQPAQFAERTDLLV